MIEYIESHGILHLFNNCFLLDVAQPLQTLLTPDSFDHRVNRIAMFLVSDRFGSFRNRRAPGDFDGVGQRLGHEPREIHSDRGDDGTSGTGLRRHVGEWNWGQRNVPYETDSRKYI